MGVGADKHKPFKYTDKISPLNIRTEIHLNTNNRSAKFTGKLWNFKHLDTKS